MPDILDELFFGNLDPSLFTVKKGSDYNKLHSEISTLLEKIADSGYEHESKLLEDALNKIDSITSRAYFTVGFRWGARIALAISNDNSDTFNLI